MAYICYLYDQRVCTLSPPDRLRIDNKMHLYLCILFYVKLKRGGLLVGLRHLREVSEIVIFNMSSNFDTDREVALMKALTQMFLNAYCLLWRWYIIKNSLSNQRKAFLSLNACINFFQAWCGLVASTTVGGMSQKWQQSMLHSQSSRWATLITLGFCTRKSLYQFLTIECQYVHFTTLLRRVLMPLS